jgi:hypothetical protein
MSIKVVLTTLNTLIILSAAFILTYLYGVWFDNSGSLFAQGYIGNLNFNVVNAIFMPLFIISSVISYVIRRSTHKSLGRLNKYAMVGVLLIVVYFLFFIGLLAYAIVNRGV